MWLTSTQGGGFRARSRFARYQYMTAVVADLVE